MKFLVPVILIIASAAIFFLFTDEVYNDVKVLQAEEAQFSEALERSKELQAVRDELNARYNTFSGSDIDKLEKLLPDGIDVVRLILELDSIAQTHGLQVNSIAVQEDAGSAEGLGPAQGAYQTVSLSFSVTATYDDFFVFIEDLERSLRIVDLASLSFTAPESGSALYTYAITLQTYWLR